MLLLQTLCDINSGHTDATEKRVLYELLVRIFADGFHHPSSVFVGVESMICWDLSPSMLSLKQ